MIENKNIKPGGKKMRPGRLKHALISILAISISCTVVFSSFGCGSSVLTANAQDLTKTISAAKIDKVNISSDFINSYADFSADVFKKSITEKKNSLISPLSIYLALSMTANGAGGNTLKEFENILGNYNLTLDDINKNSCSLSSSLTGGSSGKFNIANSIWYRQDGSLNVSKDFLQSDANYYSASAYKADFNSKQTVDDINNWVKSNTGGLIDKIVEKIDPDTMMYLFNTLYFENEWQDKYTADDVRDGQFNLDDESSVTTKFMYSEESEYLKDASAQGFMKPYKDDKYSFLALLPNEGIDVDSYASSLTGEKLLSLIKNKTGAAVNAGLPKFKAAYTKDLVDPLKAMGLSDCFDGNKADFKKMGSAGDENLYIGDVLHKTFIQVDELGTKAGAVTSVEMKATCAPVETVNLVLDRPFVYAIIDNETNLPIFIGTMHDPR